MSSKIKNNILFVSGGTGGHIFPALSVYSLLKKINDNIFFATDQRGIKFDELYQMNKLYETMLDMDMTEDLPNEIEAVFDKIRYAK